MIPLFTDTAEFAGHVPVSFPSNWHYVQQNLQRNVQTTVEFYKNNNVAYSQIQFLTRLLYSLNVPTEMDLQSYYEYLDASALKFSMSMGMTSSLSKGKMFRGEFFDDSCIEYYLALDDTIDPQAVHANWQEARAINFIAHPKSDLMNILPGCRQKYSDECGVVILSIHLPMLAIQYRAFLLEEQTHDIQRSTQTFIERFVLPNMVYSQAEISLFNRFFSRLIYGRTNVEVSVRHPFALIDVQERVENLIDQVIDNYDKIDPIFFKVLKNTPSLYSKNMLDALQLPDVAPTSQVQWLLFLSRVKAYVYLVSATLQQNFHPNQGLMNRLMQIYRSDSIIAQWKSQLPENTFDDFMNDMKFLTMYFGSNSRN